jgi:ABC-type antimicrobial peptide transport system permease subunit
MIIREGLKPVLVGLMAGLGLGVLARSTIQPLLFGIVPNADLRLMALVPALFIAAGLAACYLPARRASRVDPNVALRNL